MRAVCQRVSGAQVTVDGRIAAEIGPGLLVLLGVARGDDSTEATRLAAKIARLRVFEAADRNFDLSVLETRGSALVVSQFTLLADTRKGNRPSFSAAADSAEARPLYHEFCSALEAEGVPVERGVFGVRMQVELVNDGPVTIILDA